MATYNTKKNKQNYIVLAGRPGSGKTEMLITYANQYPDRTLFFSLEISRDDLRNRGLNRSVKVIENITEFDIKEINNFDTICIDYIQLLSKEYIYDLMKKLMQMDIRIILASQMRRNIEIHENPFEDVFNDICDVA